MSNNDPSTEDILPSRLNKHAKHKHRFNWKKWLPILVVILLVGGGVWWHETRPSPLKDFPVRGVSVDQDDGYVDFHQLQSSGIKFVYLKSTSGASYLDDDFIQNYERAAGTTMQVGVYEEYSFTSSAEQQYKYMVGQIGQQSGSLPIAIQITYYGNYADNPPNAEKQGKKLAKLINLLDARYGQGCIVWTSPTIQKQMVSPYVHYTKLWTSLNKLKHQNSMVKFIQYTGDEKVKIGGKKTDLTVSVFNGSKKEWKEEVN